MIQSDSDAVTESFDSLCEARLSGPTDWILALYKNYLFLFIIIIESIFDSLSQLIPMILTLRVSLTTNQ